MSYQVSTPTFSGPFDLLLHLITREEVDIYEVSLARIVDEYLAHVERMEGLDLEVATEFLLIAATLVELKARRLLPAPEDVDLDDDPLLEDRDLLLARLLECKTFRDAAAALAKLRDAAQRSVPRTAGPEEPFASMAPDPLSRVTLEQFLEAARRAFETPPPPRVSLDHVAPIGVTVRDAIDDVLATLPPGGTTTFRRLTAGARGRLEVVMAFLALLELYKQGVVDLEQAETFGELWVRRLTGEAEVDPRALAEWDGYRSAESPRSGAPEVDPRALAEWDGPRR